MLAGVNKFKNVGHFYHVQSFTARAMKVVEAGLLRMILQSCPNYWDQVLNNQQSSLSQNVN